jgi:hypothetical protein
MAINSRKCYLHHLLASSAIAILSAWVVPSKATTLTFEGAPSGGISSYTENGYLATFSGGSGNGYHSNSLGCFPRCADNGTFYLSVLQSFVPGDADKIVFTAVDNGSFAFSSFSGAETFAGNSYGDWAKGISVEGVRPDGTTVSQEFILDQISDGLAGDTDFQSFTSNLTGGFKKLTFKGIDNVNGGHDFAIDTVVLYEAAAAVPEPVSLLLFCIALLAAGISRSASFSPRPLLA